MHPTRATRPPAATPAHAFCLRELAATLACVAAAAGIVVPAIGGIRRASMTDVSLANLQMLGFAHQLYRLDWNDRQPALAVDGLTSFGSNATAALDNFESAMLEAHPPTYLGWGFSANGQFSTWGYFYWGGANAEIVQAFDFNTAYGHFRYSNVKAFHDYVGGRFYDRTFFAPADSVAHDAAAPWFDSPDEYVPHTVTGGDFLPSYSWSAAAMIDPDVLRRPPAGGWQHPFSLPGGLDCPSFSAALYPHLKTHMMEHYWANPPPPSACNPAFSDGTYFDCEPWYFNHSIDATQATLFYDGATRLLPNTEVQAADESVILMSGGTEGLWSRDTPLGVGGYFLDEAADFIVDVSHHVLTTDGIRGRDTLSGVAAPLGAPPRPRKRTPRDRDHRPRFLPDILAQQEDNP